MKRTKYKLGIVMDPISAIDPKKDSSLAMLVEAAKRDYEIYYMEQKDLKLIDDTAKKIISEFSNKISKLDKFERDNLEPIVENLIKSNNTNFKGVGQPLRIILTGSKFGPGIYDIIISLGKDEVIKRLGTKIA